MIIYKITNKVNGKIYVGQTTQLVACRMASHKSDAKRNRYNLPLHNAIAKYGFENFLFEEIDTANSLEELNKKEIEWISKLNCLKPNGYNLDSGGKNKATHLNTRKKMSESRKKFLANKENHPNWGRTSSKAKKVLCLNNNVTYISARKASIELQLNHSAIARVCKGEYNHIKGYRFKYL